MKQAFIAVVATVVVISPAVAQQSVFHFDWRSIISCAHEEPGHMPYNEDGQNPTEFSLAQQKWAENASRIINCQDLLAARHEGWIEGHAGKLELYDPTLE